MNDPWQTMTECNTCKCSPLSADRSNDSNWEGRGHRNNCCTVWELICWLFLQKDWMCPEILLICLSVSFSANIWFSQLLFHVNDVSLMYSYFMPPCLGCHFRVRAHACRRRKEKVVRIYVCPHPCARVHHTNVLESWQNVKSRTLYAFPRSCSFLSLYTSTHSWDSILYNITWIFNASMHSVYWWLTLRVKRP